LIDYSKLGEIGVAIEQEYKGKAQDIEGAIIIEGGHPQIYIVQTRSQI
jgi:formylmethanofuran dehydrogenase subunit C